MNRKILPYSSTAIDFYNYVDFISPYIFKGHRSISIFANINCLLLIGVNSRLENPVLNALIRKQTLLNDKFTVLYFGPH